MNQKRIATEQPMTRETESEYEREQWMIDSLRFNVEKSVGYEIIMAKIYELNQDLFSRFPMVSRAPWNWISAWTIFGDFQSVYPNVGPLSAITYEQLWQYMMENVAIAVDDLKTGLVNILGYRPYLNESYTFCNYTCNDF